MIIINVTTSNGWVNFVGGARGGVPAGAGVETHSTNDSASADIFGANYALSAGRWDTVTLETNGVFVSGSLVPVWEDSGRAIDTAIDGLVAGGLVSFVLVGFIVVRKALALGDSWGSD